ncbi:MAG: hypothetical protein U1F11_04110 [Steroidobacteraceae bacterium]
MSASIRPGSAPVRRHRIHKGRRAVPGEDPRVDTLLGMVMALTSEVAVLRERLDAHERLGAAGRTVTPQNVDEYEADEAAQRARAAQRQRLIEKVCRPLVAATQTDAEAASRSADD